MATTPIYDDQQEKEELDAINRLADNQPGTKNNNPSNRYSDDLPSSLLGSSQGDKNEACEDETETEDGADTNTLGSGASDMVGKGFRNEDKGSGKTRGKLSRTLVKDVKKGSSLKKWLGGGVGIGAIGMVVAFAVFLLSTLSIPNFAQNITAYEFARATYDSAKTTERITAEKLATDAADNAAKASMRAKFGEAFDKYTSKYQPSKVIENLKSSDKLTLQYDSNNVLKSALVDGKIVELKPTSFLGKFVPGLQFVKDLNFSRDFAPALGTALKSTEVGGIIRSAAAQSIRRQLGIGLVSWTIGKYAGKSDEQARVIQQQEAFNKINSTGGLADIASADTKAAAEKAAAAQTAAVNDPAAMAEAIKSGTNAPTAAQQALDSFLLSTANNEFMNFVKGLVKVINPVYGIAVPVCMVYDGSLANSSNTIDAQNAELQRSYYLVATAGDQQLSGNSNPEAVKAMKWKLGDYDTSSELSVPDARIGGQTYDTSQSMSSEASPIGQFSIADALFPPALATIVNRAATICPAATDLRLAVALGAANVAAQAAIFVASLGTAAPVVGGADAGAAVAETAAEAATQTIAKQLLTKMTENLTLKGLKDFGGTVIKQGALIGGATFISKVITTAQIGGLHSGLDTSAPFKNDVEAGGNLAGNEIERQAYHGVALTQQQWSENNNTAQQYVMAQNKTKSAYNRYFAVTNPYSMISRMATVVNSNFSLRSFSSIASFFGKLFNPANLLSKAVGMLTNQKALADATGTNASTNYGLVQFGWTPDEQSLIDSGPSYQPIENQKILDDSGQADAINSKYGTCFTDSMGSLLASSDPKIQRTTDGDTITDKGLCSQTNLGFNSPDSLATDTSADSPQSKDMIFRWRLAQKYSNVLDQLTNLQDVTP